MNRKTENLLKQARQEFAASQAGESEARDEATEDIRIYEGEGIWDDQLRNSRINDPKGARPCLTVSDLGPRVRQVTNDVRQNKPGIKIRPVDSSADVETAEVLNGIFRHIEQVSMADIAYETANFYQVVSGTGYFRLVVEDSTDEPGEQELFIRPIPNPFTVFMDPESLCPVGSTARFCFVVEDMLRKEFDEVYGDREEATGWDEGDGEGLNELWGQGWMTEDTIRVAEWMRLEQQDTNKIITDDGEMSEEQYWEQEERAPVRATRTDRKIVCMWRKIIGNRILKEVELPITYIPVIRVPGEMFIKSGKPVYKGLVRDSRDSVRMVSYTFSSYIESITVQTKTPYVGAAGQFEGFEDDWVNSNIENAPYLQYNPISIDGTTALPAPRREPPPMASQGIIQGLVLAKQALKDVTGLGDASLGQKGNETSGRAILARQKEGDVSTFHYSDNLSKAIRYLGTIGLQWIPKVYGPRKVVRILGENGNAQMAYLDQEQTMASRQVPYIDEQAQLMKVRTIYNLGVGCYDVVTTVGPSFSTRREEAANALSEIFKSAPALIQILGDLYMKNLDVPFSQEASDRLKAMLPPQVAQIANQGQDQAKIPPQIVAQLQMMQQQLQEGAQIVQQLQAEKQELLQELHNKDGEVRAKLAGVQAGIDEEKIKSLANINIAEINAESREKIAGLQAQVSHMQEAMGMFIEAMKGADASESETPQE